MSQSRWTPRQNRDLSPEHSSSKSTSFLLQCGIYWFHNEVKVKVSWLKQSPEKLHQRSLMKWWRTPWKDCIMNHESYCLHLSDLGMSIPVFNTQTEGKLDKPRQRTRSLLHSSPISCTVSSHFLGLCGRNDHDWGAEGREGKRELTFPCAAPGGVRRGLFRYSGSCVF